MASAVEIEPQFLHGNGTAVNGAVGAKAAHKDPPLPTTALPPPSPPATETDTETEPEAPRAASGGDDLGSNGDNNTNGTTAAPQTPTQLESPVVSPVTSPPYWMHSHPGHTRTVSTTSVDSIPGGITLRDNETSSIDDRGRGCWAKSVEVTDYVIVNGSATNIGAFVVWNIRVETLTGNFMNIRKRYSEFDDFRWRLITTFPNFEAAVPELPPKSLISKFRPRFLEKRRAGLQYFLNCILLNPEFSGSPVLKEFLFS